MKTKFFHSLILLSCLLVSACGEPTKPQDSQASIRFQKVSYNKTAAVNKEKTLSSAPISIQWASGEKRFPDDVRLQDPATSRSFVNGKLVKNEGIPLDKYLAEHGYIKFRKGKDFFPDWSLEIKVENLKPQSTIQLKNSTATLESKPNGEKLPKTSYLKHLSGLVKTGKLSDLGMPLQVEFSARDSANKTYYAQGRTFATIGDIQLKNGKLDASYDSFRTMNLIAKEFLIKNNAPSSLSARHNQYSMDKKGKGVEGLIVYSHKDTQEKQKLIRVQLLKQEQGWNAEKILQPWELLYSRKKNSTRERDSMEVMAYQKIEAFLKTKNLDNHLDSDIRCNNTKEIGLCTANITVLENDEKTCTRKAFLFNKGKHWDFRKEVSPELKIDYKTKKLVKDKRKAKSLKDYVMNKTLGLMFGKCPMF